MATTRTRPRFFLGWTVVAAAALSAFAQCAFFNPTLGVYIPQFERDFGWSRTEISLAVTTGTLAAAAITPFFGPMIDRYGGKPFVVGGGVIMAVALVFLANVHTEAEFFVTYTVGRCMAAGLLTVAATVTVSKWFIRRRSLAIGVTSLGTRLGFATMPLGVQLIINVSDWRTATYVLAVLVAMMGVLPALAWLHPRPEKLGLLPDGELVPTGDEPIHTASALEVNWTRHDAVRTRAFWLLTVAISLQTFAGGAINLRQRPYMIDRGIGPSDAALVLSLFAAFAAGGALLEGISDERLGARRTFLIGLVASAGGVAVLLMTSTFVMGVVFAAGYGVAFGVMVTSQQVVFADYFGRESLGAIRGASLPLFMLLQAAGPITAGFVFDETGSYTIAFILFAFAYLLAGAAVFSVRRPRLGTMPALRQVASS